MSAATAVVAECCLVVARAKIAVLLLQLLLALVLELAISLEDLDL